ncbi:hypothetical protein AWV80_04060 [Cupriavidus sp. UYMU48A]|nr:hypothetical protein AWV80_04060 [Cupriavidus sp. UYMU48A]
MPFDALPESSNKQWLASTSLGSGSPLSTAFDLVPPQSALTLVKRIEPLTFDPEQPGKDPSGKEFLQTHELLNDVALALTVVGPRVVISVSQWFTFDDPEVDEATSGLRRHRLLEIHPMVPAFNGPLDPGQARDIVQGYLRLTGDDRNKVRVALERLSQAQRRHNIGDQAVELATALETLLGDGNSEMTHKIKVRSTRLIGGTDEVRQRNAAIVNKTYKIRSTLVHTGKVEAGHETILGVRMNLSDIVKAAMAACATLITIIIQRGAIPKWHEFDISG